MSESTLDLLGLERPETPAERCRRALRELPDTTTLVEIIADRDVPDWRHSRLLEGAVDVLLGDCNPTQARRSGEQLRAEDLERFQRSAWALLGVAGPKWSRPETMDELERAFVDSLFLGAHAELRLDTRLERIITESGIGASPVLIVRSNNGIVHGLRAPRRTLCGLPYSTGFQPAWLANPINCVSCRRSAKDAMRAALDLDYLIERCRAKAEYVQASDIMDPEREFCPEEARRDLLRLQAERVAEVLRDLCMQAGGPEACEALFGRDLRANRTAAYEAIVAGLCADPGRELEVMRAAAAEAALPAAS